MPPAGLPDAPVGRLQAVTGSLKPGSLLRALPNRHNAVAGQGDGGHPLHAYGATLLRPDAEPASGAST